VLAARTAVYAALGGLFGGLAAACTTAVDLRNLAEGLLYVGGVGPYLPFGLVNALFGVEQEFAAVAAVGLLAAYVALLALAVLR
jgi:hypothetical protein